MRVPFIAGNWKMYKNPKEAKAFATEFLKIYEASSVKVAIAAPSIPIIGIRIKFRITFITAPASKMHIFGHVFLITMN